MSKGLKAALLSGLVFPGLGYFIVQQKLRGWLVVTISLVCFIYILQFVTDKAFEMVEQLQQQGVMPDPVSLSLRVSEVLSQSDTGLVNAALFVLVVCWLGSCVDALRLGRGMS